MKFFLKRPNLGNKVKSRTFTDTNVIAGRQISTPVKTHE